MTQSTHGFYKFFLRTDILQFDFDIPGYGYFFFFLLHDFYLYSRFYESRILPNFDNLSNDVFDYFSCSNLSFSFSESSLLM